MKYISVLAGGLLFLALARGADKFWQLRHIGGALLHDCLAFACRGSYQRSDLIQFACSSDRNSFVFISNSDPASSTAAAGRARSLREVQLRRLRRIHLLSLL